MSKLHHHFRQLIAKAHRVSMEADAETGSDNISSELDEVAAKAATQLNDGTAEAADEVADAQATAADAAAAEDNANLDTGAADLGIGADPAADAAADDAAATGEAEAASDTVLTEEEVTEIDAIETPAEEELAQELTSAAETAADTTAADAAATVEVEGALDTAAEPADPLVPETADAPVVDPATPVEAAPPAADAAPVPGEGEAAPAESATPPQQEAEAPAAGEPSEAVREVIEVVESAAAASSAEEVVQQARDTVDGLTDLRDTAQVVNENGGFSLESLHLFQLGLESYMGRLGRDTPSLGIALESYKTVKERRVISLEAIDAIIDELNGVQPILERQAIEELDRQSAASIPALTSTRERLMSVVSRAKASTVSVDGNTVDLSGGLGGALSIGGVLPEDLGDALAGYASLGKVVLCDYAPAAFSNAQQASLLVNAIDFTSVENFWEKIGKALDAVTDPRTKLTFQQLTTSLPGGVFLFGEGQEGYESPNPILSKIIEYNTNNVPLESSVGLKPDGADSATTAALSPTKIVLIGEALCDLIDICKISALLSCGQKIWPEAQDSIRQIREQLSGAPDDVTQSVGADFSQLINFMETSYSLATWPLMNYLSNLVVTANAFVLYSERSLSSKPAPEPEVVEEPVVVEPVVEDTAVVTDPVVDAAADPLAPEAVDPVVDAAADPLAGDPAAV